MEVKNKVINLSVIVLISIFVVGCSFNVIKIEDDTSIEAPENTDESTKEETSKEVISKDNTTKENEERSGMGFSFMETFMDEVEVYSMPRCYGFVKLGDARLTHDPELGFTIKGFYNGEEYIIAQIGFHAFEILKEKLQSGESEFDLPVEVKQQLSAGEKQIFVMALYQALSHLHAPKHATHARSRLQSQQYVLYCNDRCANG